MVFGVEDIEWEGKDGEVGGLPVILPALEALTCRV